MVCYTGKPRQHGINNWEVYKAHIGGKLAVQNSLERISDVAQQMRLAFERPDWPEAGRLMQERVVLPQAKFAHDLDEDHRPRYRQRPPQWRAGGQGLRSGRRRLRGPFGRT